MKLIVKNVFTKIQFNQQEKSKERRNILNTLDYKINPFRPFYFKNRAYKMGYWSGRVSIVDIRRKRFPTGLLHDVYHVLLKEQQYYQRLQIQIVDHRAQTIKPEVPIKMKIGGHYLRDYQLAGIRKAIKYQRVIINTATNSGKTSIAAGIIQIILKALDNTENILMFTQSKDVTEQDKQSLEKDLGIPVGMLGGGKHTVHQVTCATARTLSSALKDPANKVKFTSRPQKDTEYMATKYVPKFIHVNNKSRIIKAYINTHSGRYSYDRDCFKVLAFLVGYSDAKITKILQSFVQSYHKLLYKKNSKAFDKYNRMVNYLKDVKAVFVDEAQHAPSKSFRKVLNHLPNARIRVAMTGTVPSDKIKHAWFVAEFGHHILKVSNHALIKRGISATPLITLVPINYCSNYKGDMFDLEKVALDQLPLNTPQNAQSIILAQIQNKIGVVTNKYRNTVIAKLAVLLYKNHAGITLIVVNYLQQGKLIYQAIKSFMPRLVVFFLQGKDDNATRHRILSATRNGKIDILIATQVINEGLNLPSLANMIYASAGKSSVELLQRVGRLLRKYPGRKYVNLFDVYDKISDILYHQAQQRLRIYEQQKFHIMNPEQA